MATDLQNKVRMLKESELYVHFKMSALSNRQDGCACGRGD
jgi:hypothetical protein